MEKIFEKWGEIMDVRQMVRREKKREKSRLGHNYQNSEMSESEYLTTINPSLKIKKGSKTKGRTWKKKKHTLK